MRKKTLLILIFFLFSLLFSFSVREVFAQVVINEFMPNPTDGGNEWVELYNMGSTAVGLSGWSLSDSANHTKAIDILLEIPAGGFTVYVDSGDGWLNNSGGDSIILKDNLLATIDNYSYTSSFNDNQSMGRSPDGSANWVKFDTSSQRSSNPSPTTIPPTATPIPPTTTPQPTETTTNTPIPTLTPTFQPSTNTPTTKPTSTPTIKPTPTFGISLEPTDNLAPEFGQAGDLPAEEILGMEASSGGEASSSSNFSKFIKNIPWFPVIAVGIGVLFVGFSLFTFIKGNRKIPPPNL